MSRSRARSSRAAVVAIAALILVAACGGSSATPSPTANPTGTPIPPTPVPTASPSASPAAAASRLLEVTNEGGFINPAASIGALPALVVDTDGRIYTAGIAADGSSPLVPIVSVRDTGAAGAAAILAAMKAAGLDKEGSSGGVVADAGTTVFTATIGGADIVTRIAGGGMGPGGPGRPGASGAPGAAAMDLLAQLQDPAQTWGSAAAAPATTYAPVAFRVFLAPLDAADGGSLPGTPIPWPLATAPSAFGGPAAANFGVTGLRSGVVTDADAAALATAVAGAQIGTAFSVGEAIWRTWIRPLLPDELGS